MSFSALFVPVVKLTFSPTTAVKSNRAAKKKREMRCEENRGYVKRLADTMGPPLVVEQRHVEWASAPVLERLERVGVATC